MQGAIFLLLTGLIAASVFLWRGVAHDPFTVRASVQKLRIVVTLAAFAGVFVVCLRDILRRYRQEGL